MVSQSAFASSVSPVSRSSLASPDVVCRSRNASLNSGTCATFGSSRPARMSAGSTSKTDAPASPTAEVKAPAPAAADSADPDTAGMTAEWVDAIGRLQAAVPSTTFEEADTALIDADGDELTALGLVTEAARTPLQERRKAAAMAAGGNRVSALKEAEMRRTATGSARDFFKGYVEVAGQHIEQGYVDESADVMGNLGKKFQGLFGGGKQKK